MRERGSVQRRGHRQLPRLLIDWRNESTGPLREASPSRVLAAKRLTDLRGGAEASRACKRPKAGYLLLCRQCAGRREPEHLFLPRGRHAKQNMRVFRGVKYSNESSGLLPVPLQ